MSGIKRWLFTFTYSTTRPTVQRKFALIVTRCANTKCESWWRVEIALRLTFGLCGSVGDFHRGCQVKYYQRTVPVSLLTSVSAILCIALPRSILYRRKSGLQVRVLPDKLPTCSYRKKLRLRGGAPYPSYISASLHTQFVLGRDRSSTRPKHHTSASRRLSSCSLSVNGRQ